MISFNDIPLLVPDVQISHIKRIKLFGQLDKYKPDIVAITETWLDASFIEVLIPNYVIVSRRDRPQINNAYMNHGGVAVYKRNNGIPITKPEDSPVAESMVPSSTQFSQPH